MSIDRRSVLKALAAAGLAVVGVPLAQAAPWDTVVEAGGAAVEPLMLTSLVSGTALDAPFLAGVQERVGNQAGHAALTSQRLHGLEASTFTRLDTWLHDGTPTRLVGLVDDATATLVLDLVRSAGGRVMHSQHHWIGKDKAAAQWAQALGRALVTADTAPPVLSVAADPQGHAYVSFSCVI
jgi:hypothetical protein